jgi:hypothetical protein
MPIVSDVMEHLQGYKPDEHIAAPIWCEEDVIGYALNEMDGKVITREQAQSILDQIDSHHDCELGITWETIRCGIEALENPS